MKLARSLELPADKQVAGAIHRQLAKTRGDRAAREPDANVESNPIRPAEEAPAVAAHPRVGGP